MDVLIHISQQISNSTTPAFEPTAFQVPFNAVAVNMLFFLSLALVLIDAFLAMLVKGWLQEFDRGWRKYTVAHLRAQERERRLHELERWKLPELVALLPILIQGSLLLFCIGLIVLIFPLHFPSAILCSLAFVFVVGFYGFTTYVSIVNDYAPFSSPVSRLLAYGLAILHSSNRSIIHHTRRIASVIRFHNRPPLPSQKQEVHPYTPYEATQPFSSNDAVIPPHIPDSIKKGKVVPRSRFDIDPHTHVQVLERLVWMTVEAVDNIPIFLKLLDQPVKDATLCPLNVEKWKELLYITLELLKDQTTFTVSAAWTLTRAMMICYNRDTVDPQLCLTLQHYSGSQETDDRRPRMPLNVLFSSYLQFLLCHISEDDLCRNIAFLEPSDAADAELFCLVNTFRRSLQPEKLFRGHAQFFVAVLTYVASTEQSRRSKVPLTAAVIHAMHTIGSALDQEGSDSVSGLVTLPVTVSTSEPVPITFYQVAGIDALDLWSEDCIQFVASLLQRDWGSYWHNDIQLSLIAALYIGSIESTKQANTHHTLERLLEHTKITNIQSLYSGSYDGGKLAVYWYMALSQEPLGHSYDDMENVIIFREPLDHLYDVIGNTITKHSTLQLSGLRILEIAVKHVHKTATHPSDWLERRLFTFIVNNTSRSVIGVDHWVWLHLETILAPQCYLLPKEVRQLKWSDTPEKTYIAMARLDLYDSLARVDYEGALGPAPDPELLRVFLWSNDINVCTRAFKRCLEVVPISQQPDTPGVGDSAGMFIPATMGYEWVEHFVHVLCKDSYRGHLISWELLKSHLVPHWDLLPSSWCCDFASSFLFSIGHPPDMHGFPAYQSLAKFIASRPRHERPAYLLFLATMLQLIRSSLTWARITSLESWLADIPQRLDNQDAHTRMDYILASRKQELVEEALGFFSELPMAGSCMDE